MARILIVNDEESTGVLIKTILTPGGHQIHLATSGAEAFAILQKNSMDLAIVDRDMPGMTGVQVVQLIRLNPKTAKMKILMCTGASITKQIDEAFAAGADDYVLKPLNVPVFLAKVAKTLAASSTK